MRLNLDRNLSFGHFAGSLKPPQLCGAFVIKGTLKLPPNGPAVWAEEPDLIAGDVYVDDDPAKALLYASDFAVFKPRTDVLLVGHAQAPGGKPVQQLHTRFAVGNFSKSLMATGERTWRPGLMSGVFSAPQPFTKMPLSYDYAYGGPQFEKNPIGRGHKGDAAPTLTDPARPDTREPAGFGPIPPAWPQRRALVGTYKGDWLKERWPWFPRDFDWGYFNAAPRDQQLDSYLRGDEEITLENLHPEHAVVRSKLPGLRVRCFVGDRAADGRERFREVPLNLDTLCVDSDAGKLVLVWRGTADVRTPKMREIEDILVVTESLKDAPRPAKEYEAAMVRGRAGAPPVAPGPTPDELASEARFAELDREMAEMSKRMDAFDQEIAKHEAEAERVVAQALADAPPEAVLPVAQPTSAAEAAAAIAAALAAASLEHPEHAKSLAEIDPAQVTQVEQEFLETKQSMAQMEAELTPPVWTREKVQAAAAARQALTDLDLAGVDLSKLDLSRQNLSGSLMVGANLEGTNLAFANLAQVDLSGANLTKADLTSSCLDAADMTGAVLAGAKLTDLSLNRTTLAGVGLAGADLTASHGRATNLRGADLSGARFVGVTMPAADFSGCKLDGAVFNAADLAGAHFLGAKAKNINLENANLEGLHADEGADFTAGRFTGARIARAIFDTSTLDAADFRGADLRSTQFEGSSLRGANFDRANLTGAMLDGAGLQQAVMTNANLLRATLDGADLAAANLRRSNLYEAGFWLAATDGADFREANCKNTLLR